MQTLEQIFMIQNVVKIYVPGTINENEPAPVLWALILNNCLILKY